MGKPVARSTDVGSEGPTTEADDDFPSGEGAPLFVPWSRPAPWRSAQLPRWAEDVVDAVRAHLSGHGAEFAALHQGARFVDGDATEENIRDIAGIVQQLGFALMLPTPKRWERVRVAAKATAEAPSYSSAAVKAACDIIAAARGEFESGLDQWIHRAQCQVDQGKAAFAYYLLQELGDYDPSFANFALNDRKALRFVCESLEPNRGVTDERVLAELAMEAGAFECARLPGETYADALDRHRRRLAKARRDAGIHRTRSTSSDSG